LNIRAGYPLYSSSDSPHCQWRRLETTQGPWAGATSFRGSDGRVGAHHQMGTAVLRLPERCVDRPHDWRLDSAALRCEVTQPSCPAPSAPTRFLGAAPLKRLSRADLQRQAVWLQTSFPAIKKAARCRGVVFFEDEASFWLDGTLHRTWAPIGCTPLVDTYGMS